MSSEVEICNRALRRVGARRITSLTTDSSKEAESCAEFYDPLRKAMLREHVWNFAVRRAQLSQTATTPTTEWQYEYQLPTDPKHLKTVHVAGNEAMTGRLAYSQEADKILTDATTVYLTYVADISDTSEFDPLFAEALSHRLARDLALDVAQSNTTAELMDKLYMDALHDAFTSNAMDNYPEALPESPWVSIRSRKDQIFNDDH